MLTIGDKFPEFKLKATVDTEMESAFTEIDNDTYEGKWQLVFFYPKDFTFVCPTEIKAFSDLSDEFADRDCKVLAASTDTEFVHLAWRQHHEDLKDLEIPMLADVKRELSADWASCTRKKVSQTARRSSSIRRALSVTSRLPT